VKSEIEFWIVSAFQGEGNDEKKVFALFFMID
jgi:hypothetical protein